MQRFKPVIICCLTALLLTSCSKKQTLVVLLPDDQGKVGVLEVKSEGGSQIVDKPWHATRVKDGGQKPTIPEEIEKEEVNPVFKEALDIQPQPPVHFVIYFQTDTIKLRAKSRKVLPKILTSIEDRNSKDISVTGHTDRIAPNHYNMALSLKRAKYIRDYLVSHNVNPDFLEVIYHGESNPIIKTEDEVAEPKNRRVEITVR